MHIFTECLYNSGNICINILKIAVLCVDIQKTPMYNLSKILERIKKRRE